MKNHVKNSKNHVKIELKYSENVENTEK